MNNDVFQEGAETYAPYATTTLPSQETYQEIEDLANPNTGVSLRSTPPGGNPIGGVPLESPALVSIAIPFLIYLIMKRKRTNRCKL